MRLLVAYLILAVSPVLASEHGSVPGGRDFIPQPPSVVGGSVGAFFNPAAWLLQDNTEVAFYWTDQTARPGSMGNWGLSLGHRLGFSMQTKTRPDGDAPRGYDYQLGATLGNRAGGVGFGWRWGTGDGSVHGPGGLSLGLVSRPSAHWSWGLSGFIRNATDPQWGLLDVGFRPLRKPWLTIFGDYALRDKDQLRDGLWGVGAEVRPLPGIHLGFRTWEDPVEDRMQASINLGVTLDRVAFHYQPQYREHNTFHPTSRKYSDDSHLAYSSYLVRFTPPHSGIRLGRVVSKWGKPNTISALDLEKRHLTYEPRSFFAKERKSWLELSRQLDAAQADPRVVGVALNLSGTTMRPSLGWELRDRLRKLRAQGKRVFIHSDNYRMGKYYIASAADVVSMDPMGILLLPGLAFHRTYWRGFFDKIGIGAEEWRLYTHKTAFQTYARKDMSEADKEQIGRLADVIYETWRSAICKDRDITTQAFDALVNQEIIFSADQTQSKKLVDHVGTWAELKKKFTDDGYTWKRQSKGASKQTVHTDDHWGPIPEIAVVYTVGACAMDTGIQGRRTSKLVAKLAGKPEVKGLVLRVDSPGGDPLPCELINRSVHMVKKNNIPVIVSQGDVAASGGYYLSLPADTILATPLTVTGSIGVIFGWLWDDGFSRKTGFTADGIQRGRSADLFTGIKLPFLPVRVPERNLTPQELETAKKFIAHEYDLFVGSVARERGLDEAHVRKVAEGRVWMATDALEHRLIDGIGGMDDAINLARIKAGLREDDVYLVTEYPRSNYFQFPNLGFGLGSLGRVLSSRESEPGDYEAEYLKLLYGQPGKAMFLLPPGLIPEAWMPMD